MNIKAIRLFRKIVETGSLAEAAGRLNTSTSAASRLLSLLEAELGIDLFSRNHRRLELTDQGREFFRRTMHILQGIDELKEVARDVRTAGTPPLRLVSTAPVANSVIAPALAAWRRDHPESQVILNIETRFDMESRVAAREYNLGVVSLPQENAIIDLDARPILRARYELALSPDHALVERPKIAIADLAGVPLVALKSGQRWRERMEAIFTQAGVTPRIAVETGSTVIALELVRRGLGAMVVDRICSSLTPTDLVLRPLTPEVWTEYAAISSVGRESAPTHDFIAVLRRCVQELREAREDLAASVSII